MSKNYRGQVGDKLEMIKMDEGKGKMKNKWGKGLHLAHLNVRSLLGKNKADLVKKQIGDSDIDVFTLSETWLTQAIPNTLVDIKKTTPQ